MKNILTRCPSCQGDMHISALTCSDCGLELRNNFEPSVFDKLNSEQYDFLMAFLKHGGNLKEVQFEMNMSYPTVKKKLDELLIKLKLKESEKVKVKKVNIGSIKVDYSSNKASEIIKAKLIENGGHVTVYTLQGLPCEIYADSNGTTFTSDKLPCLPPYKYEVFDVVVNLLIKEGGRATKGNGRNYRFGESHCNETTIVGAVAKYRGATLGDSVFDPVFVLSAVLDWAGIADNVRGELILNRNYRNML